MIESTSAHIDRPAGAGHPRVLVFNVDGGLFAIHVDWVEAAIPLASVELHSLRAADGSRHRFFLHAGRPALVLDLRDAFGLVPLIGDTSRPDLLIARSPGLLLAIAVDGCAGERELDLNTEPPVPSGLLRDGGLPAGHIVVLDGEPLIVLDPSHVLGAAERDALISLAQGMETPRDQEGSLENVWRDVCRRPSESNLRAFAHLSGLNGQAREAAAARLVLQYLDESEPPASSDAASDGLVGEEELAAAVPPAFVRVARAQDERFVRELLCLARERASGELIVPLGDGGEESRTILKDGRVVDVHHRTLRGREAFRSIVDARPQHFYFVATGAATAEERIAESTAALLVVTLASSTCERTSGAVRSTANSRA